MNRHKKKKNPERTKYHGPVEEALASNMLEVEKVAVNRSRIKLEEWKKLIILDQVDLYASRDLDSRFSIREVSAVAEWMEREDAPRLHCMRDHPNHGVPLVGSAWGARLKDVETRRRWRVAWKKALKAEKKSKIFAPRKSYGPDQHFLAK